MLIKLELVASLYNINKYTIKKNISCIGDGMKWTIVVATPSQNGVLPEMPSTVVHDAALWLMHACSCVSALI